MLFNYLWMNLLKKQSMSKQHTFISHLLFCFIFFKFYTEKMEVSDSYIIGVELFYHSYLNTFFCCYMLYYTFLLCYFVMTFFSFHYFVSLIFSFYYYIDNSYNTCNYGVYYIYIWCVGLFFLICSIIIIFQFYA